MRKYKGRQGICKELGVLDKREREVPQRDWYSVFSRISKDWLLYSL